MSDFITAATFEKRLRAAITVAWATFSRKVGGGHLKINKEASMQLQYAYILQQLVPMTIHHPGESVEIELETGLRTKAGINEVDLLLKADSPAGKYAIAIEMKCYREKASSGKPRGAHDIFMKDVYEDLEILETYVSSGHANIGVSLVMNDLERFVSPKKRGGKCWDYDISDGHVVAAGTTITTPIGGHPVHITLAKSYTFSWEKHGDFWFAEIEGV